MILGQFAGGPAVRTDYNQTDPSKADYLVGRENIAPSGYGLGTVSTASNSTYVDDANKATLTGWYKIDSNTANGIGSSAILRVEAYASTYTMQTAIRANGGDIIMRYCNNGTWGEWEHSNAPLTLNQEYRTKERWNGKAVYTKLINLATMPNKTTSYTGKVFPVGAKNVQLTGFAYEASANVYYPLNYPGVKIFANATTNAQYIGVITEDDWSNCTAYFIAKYTKD